MWPLSARAQIALLRHHATSVRATARSLVVGQIPGVPVEGGTITVDGTSQIRRTGTVDIADPAWWPTDHRSALSPLGSELFVEYGIGLPDGTFEWVPLIQGVITAATRQRPASGTAFQLTLEDRSTRVAAAKFNAPTSTWIGRTNVSEITRLITDVFTAEEAVTVTDLTGSTQIASVITIEKERWQDGVEVLANSIAAEVFADPLGQFLIRPQPTLADAPAWVVATGEGGAVLTATDRASRDEVFNRVVATGERTDGTAPVSYVAEDNDPASPTRVNGPLGVRTRFFTSQDLTTVPQCQVAAQALLARTTGREASMTFTALVNPALDAGDVIVTRDGDATNIHIVDTVSIPLGVGDTQQLTTRTRDPLPSES